MESPPVVLDLAAFFNDFYGSRVALLLAYGLSADSPMEIAKKKPRRLWLLAHHIRVGT